MTEYFSSSVSLLLSDLCTLCKACLNLSDALCNIKRITSTFHQITKKKVKKVTLSCVLSTSHCSNKSKGKLSYLHIIDLMIPYRVTDRTK